MKNDRSLQLHLLILAVRAETVNTSEVVFCLCVVVNTHVVQNCDAVVLYRFIPVLVVSSFLFMFLLFFLFRVFVSSVKFAFSLLIVF